MSCPYNLGGECSDGIFRIELKVFRPAATGLSDIVLSPGSLIN